MTSGGSRDEFVVVHQFMIEELGLRGRSSPRLREDLRILQGGQPGLLRETSPRPPSS